jgi:hypothetical protein
MPDGRDLMTTNVNRWLRVSSLVMDAGFSPCMKDGSSCKTKWHQILPDYKRITDYHSHTGTNSPDYWEQSATKRVAGGLPRSFSQELFNQLHEWNGTRPHITPLHVRDLLIPNDCNYRAQDDEAQDSEGIDVEGSIPALEDPPPTVRFGSGDSQESLPTNPLHTCTGPSDCPPRGTTGLTPMPKRSPCNILPAHPQGTAYGTSPATSHIISSSDTSEYAPTRKVGSTGVKRKNLSTHHVIAEAAKSSGEFLAQQMKAMADASHELERRNIDVQLKLFAEQMEYQREKDRRLYESSRIAQENARLSIIK